MRTAECVCQLSRNAVQRSGVCLVHGHALVRRGLDCAPCLRLAIELSNLRLWAAFSSVCGSGLHL